MLVIIFSFILEGDVRKYFIMYKCVADRTRAGWKLLGKVTL